jgi:hypothetical protein
MSETIQPQNRTVDETIERLAETVAHLALQLTIVQLQLRALGAAAAESGLLDSTSVEGTAANIARMHAGRFLRENLGKELAELVDLPELERQIVAYLSANDDR